jgi:hypothetical protein
MHITLNALVSILIKDSGSIQLEIIVMDEDRIYVWSVDSDEHLTFNLKTNTADDISNNWADILTDASKKMYNDDSIIDEDLSSPIGG